VLAAASALHAIGDRATIRTVRAEKITLGRRPVSGLVGSVLTRDLRIGDEHWSKGRRLTRQDLGAIAASDPGDTVTVLLMDPDDLHEDEAAQRLATAVAGPGLTARGPTQSRVDLVAAVPGVVHVRVTALERINTIDPLEVFTVFDGRVVEPGDLVASVKVAPHVVARASIDAAVAIAAATSRPLVRVAPFIPSRVAVLVKQTIRGTARDRFEASVRAKIESLGSAVTSIDYVEDDPAAVAIALAAAVSGADPVDLILTAGAASTDPTDAIFRALESLGGRVVRHGVPAHPGSMLWLARLRHTTVLGLPTCGAYSMATAVDLLLPRLLSGEPATARTVARLGHGGILTRDQRSRFPRYAQALDAPEG
jgi:molybdopterin biosynthesis enzyme